MSRAHDSTQLVKLVRFHNDHLDNGFPTVRSEDRTFPRLVGDENIKSLN